MVNELCQYLYHHVRRCSWKHNTKKGVRSPTPTFVSIKGNLGGRKRPFLEPSSSSCRFPYLSKNCRNLHIISVNFTREMFLQDDDLIIGKKTANYSWKISQLKKQALQTWQKQLLECHNSLSMKVRRGRYLITCLEYKTMENDFISTQFMILLLL